MSRAVPGSGMTAAEYATVVVGAEVPSTGSRRRAKGCRANLDAARATLYEGQFEVSGPAARRRTRRHAIEGGRGAVVLPLCGERAGERVDDTATEIEAEDRAGGRRQTAEFGTVALRNSGHPRSSQRLGRETTRFTRRVW